jgi:hypothetical protein
MSKLIRDDDTGALINTDDSAYENYVNNRARRKKEREDRQKDRKDLDNLKDEISEIKSLLKVLIDKQQT